MKTNPVLLISNKDYLHILKDIENLHHSSSPRRVPRCICLSPKSSYSSELLQLQFQIPWWHRTHYPCLQHRDGSKCFLLTGNVCFKSIEQLYFPVFEYSLSRIIESWEIVWRCLISFLSTVLHVTMFFLIFIPSMSQQGMMDGVCQANFINPKSPTWVEKCWESSHWWSVESQLQLWHPYVRDFCRSLCNARSIRVDLPEQAVASSFFPNVFRCLLYLLKCNGA